MIDWKEPPARKTRGRPWSFSDEMFEELKSKPNEWALFREGTYAAHAYKMRKRYNELEVTLRRSGKNEKGTALYDIYVRYVPNAEPF